MHDAPDGFRTKTLDRIPIRFPITSNNYDIKLIVVKHFANL